MLGKLNLNEVTNTEFEEKLGDVSDFKRKGDPPHLLLDLHNCDLFDSVRPIKWTDPNDKV